MSKDFPTYSVAIRTLGTAGEKYQRLLNSIAEQTHKPENIFVYIANGYALPKETCGLEKYVYVNKGMVAQRALSYDEIDTEWILFLDDDVEILKDGVEKAFKLLDQYNADVYSPDTFEHFSISTITKLKLSIALSAIPHFWSKSKGYCVNIFGGYTYNPYSSSHVGLSTSNAGVAFLCRKQEFINIHFEEDLWLDAAPYAWPDDQVMFYKMHLNGLKILTHYHSNWKHLDAQSSTSSDRGLKLAYSVARNRKIFQHKYILPHLNFAEKCAVYVVGVYQSLLSATLNIIKGIVTRDFSLYRACKQGWRDAKAYLKNINTTA